MLIVYLTCKMFKLLSKKNRRDVWLTKRGVERKNGSCTNLYGQLRRKKKDEWDPHLRMDGCF